MDDGDEIDYWKGDSLACRDCDKFFWARCSVCKSRMQTTPKMLVCATGPVCSHECALSRGFTDLAEKKSKRIFCQSPRHQCSVCEHRRTFHLDNQAPVRNDTECHSGRIVDCDGKCFNCTGWNCLDWDNCPGCLSLICLSEVANDYCSKHGMCWCNLGAIVDYKLWYVAWTRGIGSDIVDRVPVGSFRGGPIFDHLSLSQDVGLSADTGGIVMQYIGEAACTATNPFDVCNCHYIGNEDLIPLIDPAEILNSPVVDGYRGKELFVVCNSCIAHLKSEWERTWTMGDVYSTHYRMPSGSCTWVDGVPIVRVIDCPYQGTGHDHLFDMKRVSTERLINVIRAASTDWRPRKTDSCLRRGMIGSLFDNRAYLMEIMTPELEDCIMDFVVTGIASACSDQNINFVNHNSGGHKRESKDIDSDEKDRFSMMNAIIDIVPNAYVSVNKLSSALSRLFEFTQDPPSRDYDAMLSRVIAQVSSSKRKDINGLKTAARKVGPACKAAIDAHINRVVLGIKDGDQIVH